MRNSNRWEFRGRFEHADSREEAAVLFGNADPNEVRFAGWTAKPLPRRGYEKVRTGVYRIVPMYGA